MSEHKLQFGAESAEILGKTIVESYPDFDLAGYVKEVEAEVEGLELKDRVMKMTVALRKRLPDDYKHAVQILVDSLGAEIEGDDGMFTEGWYLMPVARFVEEYGLHDWQTSLDALNQITRRHTSEYAIRPFIEQHYGDVMPILGEWVHSPSHHVRRLVSEGTRPRLPWAKKLQMFIDDPRPALALLEPLRSDESLYVRKSVANHLNDISKDHPELVLDTVERWLQESPTEHTRWIVKRGLRTLTKLDDPRVFELLGFTGGAFVELSGLTVASNELRIGEVQTFQFELTNTHHQAHQIMLKYGVHLVRKNGKRNVKMFDLGSVEIGPNTSRSVDKSQSFKPVSVRKYYPGRHQIDIVVNGLVKGSIEFELLA